MEFEAIFKGVSGGAADETKIVLELGFGHGDCITELARRTRGQALFIGSEWHRASIGHVIQKLNETGLNEETNVRILKGDFMHQIRAGFYGQQLLNEVCVFFPDPWPHEQDRPRRVINPEMVDLIWKILKPGGFLHVATDVRHYAVWVGEVLQKANGWEACLNAGHESILIQSLSNTPEDGGGFGDVPESTATYIHPDEDLKAIYGLLPRRPLWRPVTHYERRGIEVLGHHIYDFCFRKKGRG